MRYKRKSVWDKRRLQIRHLRRRALIFRQRGLIFRQRGLIFLSDLLIPQRC
jgi:hypothetical protein